MSEFDSILRSETAKTANILFSRYQLYWEDGTTTLRVRRRQPVLWGILPVIPGELAGVPGTDQE